MAAKETICGTNARGQMEDGLNSPRRTFRRTGMQRSS